MKTIREINSAILAGNFSMDELRSIWDTVKLANQRASLIKARDFAVGDRVSFVGRGGVKVQGTVTKIAVKNLVVATDRGAYRVPANMLEAA
jgi:hypothetical protein